MNPKLAPILAELGISPSCIVERGLCVFEDAHELVLAEIGDDGREHRLAPDAARAWSALKAAALRDGIALFIVSAFRSTERQAEIIRQKLDRGQHLDEILSVLAPPGCSEHHTGRAIDVCSDGCKALDTEFALTPAFVWLNEHATDFGFRLSYPINNGAGYQFEPWHWCFQAAERLETSPVKD